MSTGGGAIHYALVSLRHEHNYLLQSPTHFYLHHFETIQTPNKYSFWRHVNIKHFIIRLPNEQLSASIGFQNSLKTGLSTALSKKRRYIWNVQIDPPPVQRWEMLFLHLFDTQQRHHQNLRINLKRNIQQPIFVFTKNLSPDSLCCKIMMIRFLMLQGNFLLRRLLLMAHYYLRITFKANGPHGISRRSG